MLSHCLNLLKRVFTTYYAPNPDIHPFLSRSQTKATEPAEVTVAVLSASEGRRIFGVPLERKGIQPVFLRISNRHGQPLRLSMLEIDPHYYTPLEAAGLLHFSVLKRLSAYGIGAFFLLPLFFLMPLKLYTAALANRRMDRDFREARFPLRPIQPGETVEGFLFTSLDAGNKTVRICLYATGGAPPGEVPTTPLQLPQVAIGPAVDLTFLIPVPGISADYQRRNLSELVPESTLINCTLPDVVQRLREMPATTTCSKGKRHGDPVNLAIVGEFETILSAFTARWDECETITLSTCWKTAKAFLIGAEYRYSPVSPLYLFGRSQDIALQRTRSSINERLHLRLWMTPLRVQGRPVWVGQISRDIGVRFTTQVWNLTTHRIDPDVDESRDYVVEDLLRAERVDAVGYVNGVGACDSEHPRRNLTGDPYYTDGKRAVVALSTARTAPRYIGWA